MGTVAELGIGATVLGGLAAVALRKPGMAGKLARGANAVRQQLMLSGMALPKSILGNAGSAVEASIESGSTTPLREMFSLDTLKDVIRNYRNHGSAGPTPGVNLPGPVPGRIMGAFDSAAQSALQRAGYSGDEAANRMLQTPLGENFGKMGTVLENPVASYLHPFRRTPFNQFIEGYKRYGDTISNAPGARRTMAAYSTAGAVHGAATADDKTPMSLPIAISASGRYGLPYGIAALISRYLVGGAKDNGGVPGAVLPVSEYGFDQSIKDPLRPFKKPAALSAIEKLTQ
jgi:hypothetical protein